MGDNGDGDGLLVDDSVGTTTVIGTTASASPVSTVVSVAAVVLLALF